MGLFDLEQQHRMGKFFVSGILDLGPMLDGVYIRRHIHEKGGSTYYAYCAEFDVIRSDEKAPEYTWTKENSWIRTTES